MIKKITYRLLLLLFFLYWATTLFFIFPNNQLNLSVRQTRDIFQQLFFQRWAFFAPPPNFNQRVYIVFKKNSTVDRTVFEIIKPILDKKHQTAPFNTYYQVMDYILSTSIINLDENIRLLQKVRNYEKLYDSAALPVPDSLVIQRFTSEIEKTPEFLTLSNYARKIADENYIVAKDVSFQIQISRIPLPQFIDRNKNPGKEEVTFRSHFINFSNEKY